MLKKRSLKRIFQEEHHLPATYNTELESYLKKYDGKNGYRFSGVIMKDQVKKLNISDKMFCIVNYDKSYQTGSHWVAVVKEGNNVYHFGSYGISPLREVQAKFSKYDIYYNDRAVQLSDSSICGHLCIAFIEYLLSNKTFKEFILDCLKYSNRYKINVLNK